MRHLQLLFRPFDQWKCWIVRVERPEGWHGLHSLLISLLANLICQHLRPLLYGCWSFIVEGSCSSHFKCGHLIFVLLVNPLASSGTPERLHVGSIVIPRALRHAQFGRLGAHSLLIALTSSVSYCDMLVFFKWGWDVKALWLLPVIMAWISIL